jgi:hypothetical protein
MALMGIFIWLKGYLAIWKQRVFIKDAISSTGELKAGVPQVSVVGPLLFSLVVRYWQFWTGDSEISLKSNIELFSKCLVLKIIISVLLGLNFTSHLYDHAFKYSRIMA